VKIAMEEAKGKPQFPAAARHSLRKTSASEQRSGSARANASQSGLETSPRNAAS
jgi:hypothetical protein